jgi:hypothetical protein
VNTDELEHQLYRAERRVREIQTKLHRWATDAPNGACGEPDARPTGTSGSGGGPEKPTSRNTGRALRVDLTSAPRGALLYSQHSWEELGGRFLGLMAYLRSKGQ